MAGVADVGDSEVLMEMTSNYKLRGCVRPNTGRGEQTTGQGSGPKVPLLHPGCGYLKTTLPLSLRGRGIQTRATNPYITYRSRVKAPTETVGPPRQKGGPTARAKTPTRHKRLRALPDISQVNEDTKSSPTSEPPRGQQEGSTSTALGLATPL